mmetsp:Transcript_43583/g.102718  ORF Transcript_43583/g.102718 Transcript_43583/m.102718 type:complete len:206 (+) Transcript_43583:1567-2184(+)
MLGVIPLSQLCVHLHGHLVVLGLAEELGCLTVLALEGKNLRSDELLLLCCKAALVAILLCDAIQKVDVAHISHSDESFPCNVKAQALQGIKCQQPPVTFGDTKAGHLEGRLEVLLLDVTVERRTLRHVDRLHGNVVEAEDLGALEAHHEPLELLHVRWEGARLDAEHVVATVCQHVFHLCVPCHAVRIWLLVHQLLRIQVVDKQV